MTYPPTAASLALIARFLSGDEAAFETLFRAYQHRFLALSRRFLDDQNEAEGRGAGGVCRHLSRIAPLPPSILVSDVGVPDRGAQVRGAAAKAGAASHRSGVLGHDAGHGLPGKRFQAQTRCWCSKP